MFKYYFWLGLRSLRRNPALTTLMVLTLAVGVAASIATLAILHVMSGNPIPHKSARLLSPVLDNGPAESYVPGGKPNDVQMTYIDTRYLLKNGPGARRTAIYDVASAIEAERPDLPVTEVKGSATTSDFFAMFEVPFLFGSAWNAGDEKAEAKVIILSRNKSETLFGKENPVGRRLRVFSQDFQVVGVLDSWHPAPLYFHLINGNGGDFGAEPDFFLPMATAIAMQMPNDGNTGCTTRPKPGYQGRLESECTWLQLWFEIASEADRGGVQSYLDAYLSEQKKVGRFLRPTPAKLYDVMEWLDLNEVVDKDNKVAAWLALGFLLLCLVNTMGLLLAKFSVRASEVGVRRALGATRAAIFQQFLSETAVIGMAGAALGLLLAFLCLWLIGRQSAELSVVTHMDWQMLLLTVFLSIATSLLAGLLPTWRACQVTPAIQLKSQ